MVTVLIAEDDKNTRLLTSLKLKAYYNVETATDGFDAYNILKTKKIDLLVSDIMMPDMDGFALVKKLRSDGNKIPVIMLTAKQTISDKRTGFALGIDDYLTKPVNYEELIMRIDAVLRRSQIATDKKITIGNAVFDSVSMTATRGKEIIELPKKEFELLYKMLSYPTEIFTKNQLMEAIWGNESDTNDDTLKTHINRLRKKFENWTEFSIDTVRGLGYRIIINGGSNE